MTTASLTLTATVGVAQRPLVVAAARQLSEAVGLSLGRDWPIRIVFCGPDDEMEAGAIRIASLIEDVPRHEPIETTTARWIARIERRAHGTNPRILLATLFRHVAAPASEGASVERLRRLNMVALYLSRRAGIEIVDIDRLFAWCGARVLHTDYRCLGERAAAVGGHVIAAAILAGGLDDILPPEIQEAAAARHGGVQNIANIVKRRIPQP